MTAKTVALELSQDEALVLFDLLGRINADDQLELFEHPAEEQALWNLETALEKKLEETFDLEYDVLVAAARERLVPTNT